ncbi:hypothetical protein BDZ91DRAFT_212500 [Kalaharituber pfeilii]|nr:hypothetical protein BDZ91DRAFT_212500 [Kalaharituber pfeilii]
MKTASRTRDRGLPSGKEARYTNDDSNHVTDPVGNMYERNNSDRNESAVTSRNYRRDGASSKVTSVDQSSAVNLPSMSTTAAASVSSSGRNSATRRGSSRGGSSPSQGYEQLQTTVPMRPGTVPSSPLDTANKHFPLNDIDYESSPAAVAQELSNLQALRRMSMDASAAADPDLPGFNISSFTAPTGADDDYDARRLFWVPARLHPELAPEGWKAFVEARVKEIRSPGAGKDSLLSVGNHPGLRRKKSMLSKQIDNTGGKGAEGYEDGAERLERRRSQNGAPPMLKVSDLEKLVNDPSSLIRKLSVSPAMREGANGKLDDDLPILPAPLGHTLRRSTRTTYRKDRGRRLNRGAETDIDESSPGNSPGSPKIELTLQRVQTEPISLPSTERPVNRIHGRPIDASSTESRETNERKDSSIRQVPATLPTPAPGPTPSTSFEDMLANSTSIPPVSGASASKSSSSKPNKRSSSPSRSSPHLSHTRRESQDKQVPVPRIVETPPAENSQIMKHPERNPPQQAPSSQSQSVSKSSKRSPKPDGPTAPVSETSPSNRPSSAGRDSLAPSSEEKATKRTGRSDSISSTRKSSWGWLLGDSDKEQKEPKEKASEKDVASDRAAKPRKSKTTKIEKAADKDHARLDVIQKSIDGKEISQSEKGADAVGSSKERVEAGSSRKANSQESSSSKKEKEKDSGLFSSLFGGSRKKSGSESHKSKSARTASPERPHVQLNFYYTRFPIHIERAIYRLSHLKLANPRRPLLQQVLLSNFMYSYLAKVQMTQPTLLQQQQQQQQQLLQQQQQQQQEYEQQQQLYQQQQYEQAQYEQQQAEQYYHYDDGSNGPVDYAEDSQMYEYEEDDQMHHQHRQYQHPPRSHSQNAQFFPGQVDGGVEYEQQQYHQQYYSPSQQQQQYLPNGVSHKDDGMW